MFVNTIIPAAADILTDRVSDEADHRRQEDLREAGPDVKNKLNIF